MSQWVKFSQKIFIRLILLSGVLLIAGCQLIPDSMRGSSAAQVEDITPEAEICLAKDPTQATENNCDMVYWIEYWTTHGGKPWYQRKNQIQQLGDSVAERFKKILLSQGKGTPYQDRLRAQNWAEQLSPMLTDTMASFLNIVIFQTSQELLEFESALTILTRVNGDQARQLEEQSRQLKTQQQQIEKLLKIEASIMEKREGINQ